MATVSVSGIPVVTIGFQTVAAFFVSQLAGMPVAVGLSRLLWRKRMSGAGSP